MFFKIFCLAVILNFVQCSASLSEEFEDTASNSGNAPFFELPCMVVGGTCARSVACPVGTKVGAKGLCPVQQEHGMECCRPTQVEIKCRSKGDEEDISNEDHPIMKAANWYYRYRPPIRDPVKELETEAQM